MRFAFNEKYRVTGAKLRSFFSDRLNFNSKRFPNTFGQILGARQDCEPQPAKPRTKFFDSYDFTLHIMTLFLTLMSAPGCQKSSLQGTPHKPPTTGEAQSGGMDSGGAGGLKGVPLESYQVDFRNAFGEIYTEILLPLLNTVEIEFKPLAADLLHIILHRTWYLVPVDLNKIPASSMGIPLDNQVMDQLAVQTRNEIWINKIEFDKMASEHQIRLLLHELILGIRLMTYSAPLDHCLALGLRETTPLLSENNFQERKDFCFEKYSSPEKQFKEYFESTPRLFLSLEDYEQVRHLNSLFYKDYREIKTKQWRYIWQESLKRND